MNKSEKIIFIIKIVIGISAFIYGYMEMDYFLPIFFGVFAIIVINDFLCGFENER